MKDSELAAVLRAEEEAEWRKADIASRHERGALDADAAERVAALIDEHRLYKARGAMDRAEEFLAELRRQFLMTIRQLEVDDAKAYL